MKKIVIYSICLSYCFSFFNCTPKQADSSQEKVLAQAVEDVKLTPELAAHIFSIPTHCIEVEYPNKLGQTLGSDSDLKTPKQLRPIFYGCFDWHSSVHGFWSIVTLMQHYPNLDKEHFEVRERLNKLINKENAAVELAFFQDKNNLSFERTYGWAWLFKLQESLLNWQDADAKRWASDLQPIADLLVSRYKEYLPKLVYPIRTGQHDNSAFGLSLSLDYARAIGDKAFEQVIVEHSKRLFGDDVGCPLSYEPSGYDFLSPCLEEAGLMSKILPKNEFDGWLDKFLPQLKDENFVLEPAVVKDRTDGKLVHLDGLNYSRASCLYEIAGKSEQQGNHLRQIAQKHIAFSLPNLLAEDDYMGSHWLGTFALYALLKSN